MKVNSLYIFLIILFLNIPKLGQVRDLYRQADASKKQSESFHVLLKDVSMADGPTLMGYKAASEALLSKYAQGIKNKKEEFDVAVSQLEKIIKNNPENIELYFIRLSIQENAPKILKYHNNINEDKSFILSNIERIDDKDLSRYLQDYVLHSNTFSAAEKSVLSER